jgi:hypothetical protein
MKYRLLNALLFVLVAVIVILVALLGILTP